MKATAKLKWAFTFSLLGVCVWWFHEVWDNADLLNTAFSGALVVLFSLVVQHWFRKGKPEDYEEK